MRRVLIILIINLIAYMIIRDVYSKSFTAFVSRDDIVVLRLQNVSKEDEKIKYSINVKQKEIYSSDLVNIKGEESIYIPLSELLKSHFSEKEEGLLIKIDIKADHINNIDYQIITMSSRGGIMVSKEADRLLPPIIYKIMPEKASTQGGGLLTIIGSNFDESAIVKIDDIETLRLRESQNKLIAIIPPHKPGKVSVKVENAGQKPFILSNALEYVLPQPVIQNISPSSCKQDGGITVEIYGANFSEDSKVYFNNVIAISTTFVNESRLLAVAPPHKIGTVSIKVVNSDGSQAILNNAFEYYGHPYIKSVSPNMGPPEGGTLITIVGENFEEDSVVFFDNNAAQINFAKSGIISVYSPPHSSGYVSIEIKNPNSLSTSLPNAFLYNSPPKLIEAYAYPNPCLKRARIRVIANAIDPENHRLFYQWNVAGSIGGTIIGSGNEIMFECPNIEGEATINVVISDEYNASIKTSVSVSVR